MKKIDRKQGKNSVIIIIVVVIYPWDSDENKVSKQQIAVNIRYTYTKRIQNKANVSQKHTGIVTAFCFSF